MLLEETMTISFRLGSRVRKKLTPEEEAKLTAKLSHSQYQYRQYRYEEQQRSRPGRSDGHPFPYG